MAGKGGSLGELYFSITGEDRLEEILRKDKKLAEEVAKIAGGIQIGRTRVTQEAAKAIVAEANAQEKVAQSKLKTAQYEEKVAIASSNRLAADEKAITAMIRREAAEISLQNAQDRRAASQKKLSLADETAIGSIKMLEAELKKLKDTYRSLSETDRNSILGKTMLTQINNADQNLAKINAEMANNSALAKTMGNQYNGLRTQISMVARELPNLGISLSTFIISLSNNLPYLADEIAKANKEFNELKKTSQAATPVWKQMIGAIFNWQTALIVGVTVLTAYSREIQAWVGGLLDGNGAASELAKTQKTLNDLHDNAIKNSAKETAQLQLLYGVTQDTTRTIQERTAAAEQLQKLFPDYFGNLSTEIIMVGSAKTAYDALAKSIEDVASAKIIEEGFAESIENMESAIKKRNNAQTKLIELNDKLKNQTSNPFAINYEEVAATRSAIAVYTQQLNDANDAINMINKSYKELQDAYKPKNLTSPIVEQPLTQSKYYNDYIETLNKLRVSLELAEIDQLEFNKRENEAVGVMINAAKAAGINDAVLQKYIERYKEFNKQQQINKQLKASEKEETDVYKREQEYLKASLKLQEAIRKAELDIEQTRIKLMNDGSNKELAQIDFNYKLRKEEIRKQTEEYIKLIQEEEKKAWLAENPTKKEKDYKSSTITRSDLPQKLKDNLNKADSLANKQREKETQDLINGLMYKWSQYADKRQAIEIDFNNKVKQIEQERASIGNELANKALEKAQNDRKNALEELEQELFSLTDIYRKVFGDVSELTLSTLKDLVSQSEKIISTAKGQFNDKGELIGYTVSYDGKTFQLAVNQLDRFRKKIVELKQDVNKEDPFGALASYATDFIKSLKDVEKAQQEVELAKNGAGTIVGSNYDKETNKITLNLKSQKQAEDELSDAISNREKSLKGIGNAANSVGQIVQGLTNDWANMFSALGNEDMADTLGAIGEIAGQVGKLAQDLASGNPVQQAVGVLSFVPNIIGSIAQLHDKRLDKAIKRSQLEVQKLQGSYEDLERLIDRQLGAVTEDQAKQQIENLRLQREELYKQMQAESDKKKSDEGAVEDYKKQIKELDDQIQYFYEDLAGEQFGINIKDWAGQIADALTEAFAKGEDAAEAFDDTVASIMKSVFKNVIQLQYIEPAMKKLREYLFGTNGAGGVLGDGDLSSTDMNGLVKELMGFKDKINESQKLWDILNEAAEKAGVSMVEEDKKKKEGLSQSIQGVTEDTANVLGSYLNAIRADVSANRADVSANRVNLQKLVDNAVPFYNDFALHVANLKHLETIAVNTGRNADIVGRIENILTAVTQPGSGRKFNIQ